MATEQEDYSKMSRFIECPTNPQETLRNNYPCEDFFGLTPMEMERLLHNPYGNDSGFHVNNVSNDFLNQIPFLLLMEYFLGMIARDYYVRLTPKGFLPHKYCHELLETGFIKDWFFESHIRKITPETSFSSVQAIKLNAELAGLTYKSKNKIFISQKAFELLNKSNRNDLFRRIFETFTVKFLWSFLDRYESEFIGQLGFAFSLSLLKYFGSLSHPVFFYANKYKIAFPLLQSHTNGFMNFSNEEYFLHCYATRVFARFFEWFGLVQVDSNYDTVFTHNNLYTKTKLVDALYDVPELFVM